MLKIFYVLTQSYTDIYVFVLKWHRYNTLNVWQVVNSFCTLELNVVIVLIITLTFTEYLLRILLSFLTYRISFNFNSHSNILGIYYCPTPILQMRK